MKMLNDKIATNAFAALGSKPRLLVLQSLIKAGNLGLSISNIHQRTNIPLSTLAHHLRHLSEANLIIQKQVGREKMNFANYHMVEDLSKFLLVECCTEQREK